MEPYHELEAAGYEFSEIPSAEDYIEQFNYSVKQVSKEENNVIFERSVIDLLAYLHAIDPNRHIQPMDLYQTAETRCSVKYCNKSCLTPLGHLPKIKTKCI
jgi:hypothetical protein